jgi:4'-phosphopantetheinyl transferase
MMASNQQWLASPERLGLPERAIHIWRASLDQPETAMQRLRATISADEQARATQFRFERDRQRFIAARGILRRLLGSYLDADPRSLRFTYNAYGKPALVQRSHAQPALRFNLAHSQSLALFAFALDREVGIDVEYMKPDIDCEQVARHSFSTNEQAVLLALPPEERIQSFYRCWTRKEAYIKARGLGVSLPLDSFDVSLKPGEPAAVLASREDQGETARWTLCDIAPGEGYAGALATEGKGWHTHYFQMQFS